MRVIAELSGWRHSEGGLFIAARGEAVGRIACGVERPLRSYAAVVLGALARVPDLDRPEIRAADRVVTAEGEHGFLATVRGAAVDVEVGVVLGDVEYLLVLGETREPEGRAALAQAVRTLVLRSTVGLGVRPRRFVYTPPPGWQGVAHGLTTRWIPPGFPRDRAMLTVFPATPIVAPLESALEQLLETDRAESFVLGGLTGPRTLRPPRLAGSAWRVTGRFADGQLALREVVLLRDDLLQYSFIMESVDTGREELAAVLDSAEPVPRGAPQDPEIVTQALSHWTV